MDIDSGNTALKLDFEEEEPPLGAPAFDDVMGDRGVNDYAGPIALNDEDFKKLCHAYFRAAHAPFLLIIKDELMRVADEEEYSDLEVEHPDRLWGVVDGQNARHHIRVVKIFQCGNDQPDFEKQFALDPAVIRENPGLYGFPLRRPTSQAGFNGGDFHLD